MMNIDDIGTSQKYYEVKPVSFIAREPKQNSNDDFTGVVQYKFVVPEGYFTVLKESYMTVKMECYGLDVNAVPANRLRVLLNDPIYNDDYAPGNELATVINSNPCAILFDRFEYSLNNNTISDNKFLSQTDQLLKMTYETEKTLLKGMSGSHIYINKLNNDNISLPANEEIEVFNEQPRNVNNSNRRHATKSVFYNSATNKITWKPFVGVLKCEQPFFSGTSHEINLYIDNNYRNKLIYSNGDYPAGEPTLGRNITTFLGC